MGYGKASGDFLCRRIVLFNASIRRRSGIGSSSLQTAGISADRTRGVIFRVTAKSVRPLASPEADGSDWKALAGMRRSRPRGDGV